MAASGSNPFAVAFHMYIGALALALGFAVGPGAAVAVLVAGFALLIVSSLL